MTDKTKKNPDGDAGKGATESQSPHDTVRRPDHRSNLADQLPHREGSDFEGADSDFPEPGSNPEHSGQHR